LLTGTLERSIQPPSGIAIDKGGNLVIADTSNNRIAGFLPTAQVTTVAGSGVAG